MRLRLTCLLLGILLVPASARADFHKVDFYEGFSFGNGASKLFGIHTSAGLREPASIPRWFTPIADISLQIGKHGDSTVPQVATLFGGRFLFTPLTPPGKNCGVFGQVFAGNVYQNDSVSPDHNNGAVSVGFGFEYFKDPETTEQIGGQSIKTHYGWGVRAQVDFITRPWDERKDFWRFSIGVVHRIPRKH